MAPSALSNAYLDSASLHLGRGFRHMHFTATSASSNAYLDSASLHLGRGFRHMHFTATSASSNAYLDSAPLHLGRGFRHMEKDKEIPREMQALPWGFPYLFPRCSMLNVKNRRPRSFYVCKNSDFKCAIRGSNPGHPD